MSFEVYFFVLTSLAYVTCSVKLRVRRTKNEHSPFVVALTGGPCGGKSSGLQAMSEVFKKLSIPYFTIPEVPTIMMSNGAQYPGSSNPEKLKVFEKSMISLQLDIENAFLSIARHRSDPDSYPPIIVCDRGVIDIAAYLPLDLWQTLLNELGLQEDILNLRYDIVCHLVTAADGTQFYTTSNNSSRTETVQEAVDLDRKTQRAWSKHPRHSIIDNKDKDFPQKMRELVKMVLGAYYNRLEDEGLTLPGAQSFCSAVEQKVK